MAKEIGFKITVDTDVADLNVGELKESIKQLNEQLKNADRNSAEFKDKLTKLGEVRGELKKMGDDIKAINPAKMFDTLATASSKVASGIAAASGAMALFGGESDDLNKVLVRVQSTMALAQGLQGLSGFTRALGTAKTAMISFALSNPFTAILAGVTALVTGIITLVNALDDAKEITENLQAANDKLKESYDDISNSVDAATKKMKAFGASEEEIYKTEQAGRKAEWENLRQQQENAKKALQELLNTGNAKWDDVKTLREQIESLGKDMDSKREEMIVAWKEHRNEMNEQAASDSDAYWSQIEANYEKNQKKQEDKDKEAADKRKELRDKEEKENQRKNLEAVRSQIQANADILASDEQKLKDKEQLLVDEYEANQRILEKELAAEKKKADEEKELQRQIHQEKIKLGHDAFNAMKALADTLFDNALLRAKGNEKEERRIRKNQFNFNKAVSITETLMAGAEATIQALKIPPPAGEIIAGIRAGITGVQVAAIAAKKFPEGGGDGGGGSVVAPNIGGGQQIQANQLSTGSTLINQEGTGFQQPSAMRAYVVETDITQSQKTIRSIEERTTY